MNDTKKDSGTPAEDIQALKSEMGLIKQWLFELAQFIETQTLEAQTKVMEAAAAKKLVSGGKIIKPSLSDVSYVG